MNERFTFQQFLDILQICLSNRDQKVTAIKSVRMVLDCGLLESKRAVEAIQALVPPSNSDAQTFLMQERQENQSLRMREARLDGQVEVLKGLMRDVLRDARY